jgi:alanine-synthesizing transaminase
MFSKRFPWGPSPNRLTELLAAKRAAGVRVLDLSESNPTQAGLQYDRDAILGALALPAALVYEPQPRGLAAAREAVAGYYRARGLAADPAAVHLTASTSEAYSYLFKLLCDPDDAVLVPRPSYPLLDLLAAVECVALQPYPLHYERGRGWGIDVDGLLRAVTARTRAVVLVNPNNPTGSFLKSDELASLDRLCGEREIALIADEVFGDYAAAAGVAGTQAASGVEARRAAAGAVPALVPSLVTRDAGLTFVLSGLSKVVGLPQVKLGWIHVSGPPALRARAQEGLDWIADTFLSVSTPGQHALPRLIALQPTMQERIVARVEANERRLRSDLARAPSCRALEREGGWYAVLDIPRAPTDEEWALQLLQRDDVLLQPGYFFDFPDEGHLVLSLLTEPATFAEGTRRMVNRLAAA